MSDEIRISKDELRELVRQGVHDGLADIGIHVGDPERLERWRRNFAFLYDLRRSTEGAKSKAGLLLVVLVFGALVSMMTAGFKSWLAGT